MKALIVGCSYTKGHGLNLEKTDPRLWANRLVNHISPGCEIVNLAESGKNNDWIFTEACAELTRNNYDIVLIGWTVQTRLNMNVGLEKYCTHTRFRDSDIDININPSRTVSGKYLKKLGDELSALQNDHWYLLDLIKYVNILYEIQVKTRKQRLICVNNLLEISNDYFVKKDFTLPSELSKFQQNILNTETRDDNEIKDLYEMIHQQYAHYGGIIPTVWLNLYQSFKSMQIDFVSDVDLHPGYKSQDVFTKYLITQFDENSNNSH